MTYHSVKDDVCLNTLFKNGNTSCISKEELLGHQGVPVSSFTDAIMWAPIAFIWALSPLYLVYLVAQRKRPARQKGTRKFSMYTTVFLIALTTLQLYSESHGCSRETQTNDQYHADWMRIGTLMLVVVLMKLESSRGFTSSVPMFFFWLLMLMSSIMTAYNTFLHESPVKRSTVYLSVATICGVLGQLASLGTVRKQRLMTDKRPSHPEDGASFISNLLVHWVTSVVWTGYKKKLDEKDIPEISEGDRCDTIYPAFEHTWQLEEEKCKQHNLTERLEQKRNFAHDHEVEQPDTSLYSNKLYTSLTAMFIRRSSDSKGTAEERLPSLLTVLVKTYGLKYFALQICRCVIELCDFLNPLMTEALLKYIQHRDTEPQWKGYSIVLAMFLTSALTETLRRRIMVSIQRLSRHMRTAMRMAVFKKALTASNESKKERTSGELVSLITEDTEKLIRASDTVFYIILTPVQVSIAIYMLYRQLGTASIAALAIMLSLIPLNSWVGKKLQVLEKRKNEVKDERIKVMNEILNGIKVLKLYAWEKSFIKKVSGIRDQEVNINMLISVCHAGIDLMFRAIPFLVRLVAFAVFILLGGYLDPAKAYVTTSLFYILNGPFSIMALIIPECIEASVSIKRLNNYLNSKDIPDDIVLVDPTADLAITIENGTFTWDSDSRTPTLQNINLRVPKGGLVAVVGMVGTGKSSLLSAILGEMEKLKGMVTVQSSTAYVSQEAWIQNATLQDNVLFGSQFESKRYRKVINACALKEDFKILAAADKTEIGEKGINLSGGQKQRVSLARAVYSDADIYLLDDPLSAVDAHVGKHIFNNVIGHRGMLRDKTRVLVTHGVHWLPFVDQIIVMKDGRISESGTYKQLLSHDGAFAHFLREVLARETEQNDKEVQQVRANIRTRLNSIGEQDYRVLRALSVQEAICTIDTEDPKSASSSEDEAQDDSSSEEDEDDHYTSDRPDENNSYEMSGKLVEDEDVENRSVTLEVYKEYVRAVGSWYVVFFAVMYCLFLVSRDFKVLWMGRWTEDPLLADRSLADTAEYRARSWMYITVYAISGGFEVVLSFFFIIVVQARTFSAANNLHSKLLTNILRAPMSFFDTTPTGRIINRFSKDVRCVDGLGNCVQGYIRCVGNIVFHLLMILYLTPTVIAFVFLVTLVYVFLQRLFVASARQLRRYRSKTSSPIYIHFKETLSGVTTIRAFKAQPQFVKKMERTIENNLKFDLMEMFVVKWFGIRMTFLSTLVAFAAGLVVLSDFDIPASKAGMILGYSTWFVHCLGWFIYHSTHTEQELVSLERVLEYSNKPTEAAWEVEASSLPKDWPQSGEIVLKDYKVRYREGLDLVLKGVTCRIRRGEKVGIVGRTGAGKSSLMLALFRLVEAAGGQIRVDNQVIANLGLHDLRKRITILPQDPVVFGGSLRMNLDPFSEKSTEELWEALGHSHLKTFVESLPGQLEADCGEAGQNLSVGQRQLVCLARTLLRKTKILVLDEATAAVDMETDDLIQKTICSEFKDCTVLTIAHRLNTIMDYDRILVLDQGLIKEFDSPKKLLADTSSMFYALAKDANLV